MSEANSYFIRPYEAQPADFLAADLHTEPMLRTVEVQSNLDLILPCIRSVLFVGCWLLVVGCWLLVVGCWLLVVGCWWLVLLDNSFVICKSLCSRALIQKDMEPFILVGPEGCGKSMLLRNCFSQLRSTSVATIHCSSQTTAQHVIQKLQQACAVFTSNAGMYT
jgi:hypothetical protein